MATLSGLVYSDRVSIISELPITISYNGTSYTARKTSIKRKMLYTLYGLDSGYDFSIMLAESGTSFDVEGIVVYNGLSWRIIDKEEGEVGVGCILHLGKALL